jgi:cytochrome c oxidase subunit 3
MASSADMTHEENHWHGSSRPLGARYGKLMMWFFLLSDALTFSGFLTAYGLMRFKYESTWPIAENVFTHFPGLEGDHPLLYVALMTFILIMSSVTMVLAVNSGEKMKRSSVTMWMLLTIIGGLIFVGSQAWEWYHFIMGDAGAVETSRQEILHVYTNEGERLSFSQLVHGMENGHASNHGETFTKEEVLHALEANQNVHLQEPGKAGEVYTHAQSVAYLKGGDVVQGANMIHNEYGRKQFANFFFFITGFHGFHVFSGVVINFVIFYNILLGTYERRGHYRMVEKVGLYWHFVDLVWVFVFTFFYLV